MEYWQRYKVRGMIWDVLTGWGWSEWMTTETSCEDAAMIQGWRRWPDATEMELGFYEVVQDDEDWGGPDYDDL
jgi:hypothetical protein